MCPGNHKFTEEKLRELGVPELFISESQKMHEEYCTTHDFDALVQEIIDCWEYAKQVMKEKKDGSTKLDG